MKAYTTYLILLLASFAIFGVLFQSCARGDAGSTATEGEPEFTITGEAI